MNFDTVIRRRKMVRHYTSQPVDAESLDRIVSAGMRVPSAGNSQGQRITVVTKQADRSAIAELADEPHWVKRGKPPWLSVAPVHLVLSTSEIAYRTRYSEGDKHSGGDHPVDSWDVPYWWVDAGATMMAILLAATNEGLSAGFLGSHALPGLAHYLDLARSELVVGVITIGHAASADPVGSALRPRSKGTVTWR